MNLIQMCSTQNIYNVQHLALTVRAKSQKQKK